MVVVCYGVNQMIIHFSKASITPSIHSCIRPFLQIILALSSNQQRRPLPSRLSASYSMRAAKCKNIKMSSLLVRFLSTTTWWWPLTEAAQARPSVAPAAEGRAGLVSDPSTRRRSLAGPQTQSEHNRVKIGRPKQNSDCFRNVMQSVRYVRRNIVSLAGISLILVVKTCFHFFETLLSSERYLLLYQSSNRFIFPIYIVHFRETTTK